MKTDAEAKGQRGSNTTARRKSRTFVSKSDGKLPEQKRRKLSDVHCRHIIDKFDEGFVSFDMQMNYLYINQRGSELLERKPDELIGKNHWEVYPEDKDTAFGRAYLQALESQTPIELEDFYAPGQRWLKKRVYPSTSGLSIFFSDITERKQTESTPSRIGERLPGVYQHAPVGIVECSPEGQYLNVNDEFCRMLGYGRQDLLARHFRDVTHAEDIAADLDLHQQLIAGELPFYKIEKRYVRKDKEVIWAEVTRSAAHDPGGNVLYTIGIALDVTARKKAESEIRSISKLPAENPNPIMRLTPDGKVMYANPVAATMLNLGNGGLYQTLPNELQKQVTEAFASGLKKQVEIELDGRTFSCTLVPIPEPGYINFYGNEITERKQAEQALREKDQQLHHITEITPTLLTECDRDFRYRFVNRAAAEFLGLPAEEILGQPIRQIMGDAAFEKILPYIERALKGERIEYEMELPYRATGPRFVHVIYVPKRDDAGNVIGWLATVNDITERKQTEERLRQSEERFRMLSNTVPSLVWSTAPDGTIQYVNEHWRNYTGLSTEESISNWVQLIHPDDVERVTAAWNEALATIPDEYLMEVRYRRYDGEYRWFQSRAIPARDENGNVIGWYGVTTNIHDRVEGENRLRESEERLRLAAQAARACTWEINLQDQSYKLGDNFKEVLGFSPDLLPKKSDEVVAMINEPEDLQVVQETVARAIQTRSELPPLQYRVINPQSREIIWLEVNAQLVYDAEGNPQRMFGMVQNITGRKAEEDVLNRLLQRERKQREQAEKAKTEADEARTQAEQTLLHQKQAEAALGTWAEAPLPQDTRPWWLQYGMALVATAIAVLMRHLLDSVLGNQLQFTPLFGAIAFSVWYGGLGPAFLSAIAGYMVTSWFFIEPRPGLGWDAMNIAGFAIYLVSSTVIVSLGDAMQRAQRHAHQSARVAVERKREAEFRLAEQKRVEEALRASERRFRDIFETVGVSVWEQDFTQVQSAIEQLRAQGIQDFRAYFAQNPDFVQEAIDLARPIDVNSETLQLFGAKDKDELLRSLHDVFMRETAPIFLEEIIALAEGRPIMRSEAQVRTLDGRLISVLFTMHFSTQADDYSRVIITLTDITDRKHSEEALRSAAEANAKFRTFFDQGSYFAGVMTLDGTLVEANRLCLEFCGFTREDVIGKKFWDCGWWNPSPALMEMVRHGTKAAAEGQLFRTESTYYLADGTLRFVDLIIAPVKDETGKLLFLAPTGTDITERRRGELALLEYARQQTALYELSEQLQRMNSEEEIYSAALHAILSGVRCERASILLFDQMDTMRFVAWRGLSDEYRHATEGHSPWMRDEPSPRPITLRDIEVAELSDSLKAALRAEGIAALAFIPLISEGKLIGKFMVYFNAPHTFGEAEIDLSQTIAHQVAAAIERKRAEETLRRSAEYDAFRVTLADTLRALTDPVDIQVEAMRVLGEHLQVDRVVYSEIDERDEAAVIVENYVNGVPKIIGRIPLKDFGTSSEILRSGQLLNLTNVTGATELSETDRASFAALGVVSTLAVPIFKAGRWAASLAVHHGAARIWTENEIAFLEEATERTWTAIERARAQRALRTSESLYRTIARSIPGGGVYVIDEDFRYLVAEGPVTEAFGLTRELLEGHTVAEAFPGKRAEEMEARLRRNLAGETVSYETALHGRVFWTQQAPIAGSIGKVIIVTIDITERKRAEEALRSSEERMRLAIEANRMVTWEWDTVTDRITTSDNFNEIYGLPDRSGTAEGFALVWQEDLPAHKEKVDQVVRQGGEYQSEFRITRPVDDRVIWLEERAAAITDAEGHATRLVGVVTDITERKRIEQSLRESEERFTQFMQYLPGLAWIKDINGRYVYANAAAEKAFGTPRENLYGKTDPEVFPLEAAAQFMKNDHKALTAREAVQIVETFQQDDGVLHYSLVTKFPILGSDGDIWMIGGTAFDITDRIQMEEALRQARERAEKTASRAARLQQVTASLVGAATPARLAELMLEQGTRATGSAASILAELVNDGQWLKTIAALGYPPAAVRMDPVPLSAKTPMSDCILTKQAIWLGSHDEFTVHYPDLAEARRGFGNEATVALPLVVGDRVLGGLAFSFIEKREFPPEEREFFIAVAQQCAQGLERVRGAQALRESEERYRALVNQATAGIVRKAASGKILFVNEAFCEMLGYRVEDLVGKTMWQFTHTEDVLENRRLFNRLMLEGIPFHLEKRLVHRDGSILWATVSVSPVLDADGKPESAVSVYADITERKQVEVDLNESRERFRNLFNLVPVAVYTCDADGLIQEFNRSAVELWGREPIRNDPSERFCGSFKIYYPDGRFMLHRICPMARILRGETLDPSELEIVVERRDGSRRHVIAHPLALRNESGKIVGAINCLYDMTDRKQAESRLALLAQVSDFARIHEDPVELMSAVADAVGKHFRARRCLFDEVNLKEGLETVHHNYHDGAESVVGVHNISDYSSITTAEIRAGKTIVNHDSQSDPRTANDYERIYQRTGERAYVAVPLMREEEWAATLWISDDAPRQWSGEEVSLLQAVAERTWTAAEKLRIDAELRDSEERLRVTFNTTAVGFATLTPATFFVDVNQAFCEIVGYSREELLGMNCNTLTHPGFLSSMEEHVAQLLAGAVASFVIEKLYIRKDGQQIWVQDSVSLVRDAEGDPLHLIAICQDITERKQAEEALQQLNLELEHRVLIRTAELSATNEHLLEEIEERAMVEEALRESDATTRLILDTSPDAIVITNRDGRIMRVNAQIEYLFGHRPQDVLGEKIEILIPERFHWQHVHHRASYSKSPHRRPMGMGVELFGRRKDSAEFPVDVTLTPIQNQNISDWDTMVTIRDSTERKRMEAELRESHKRLQALSQRLVEVQEEERRAIARELHDRVGQSLAALSLNLTIVNNSLASVVDEQVNLRLADSRQLVTEVIALVRDVMADLRPAVLDDYGLEAALNTTLEKLKTRFGIDIRFEKNQRLIPRLGPTIEMTLLRIAQEAVVNAGRHAQADQVNLSLQLEENAMRLIIRDDGTGIQSWEQANRPGSHGLTIMRERAEAVGGSFKVSSTPGQGTKIEVRVPVQHPEEQSR